MPRTMAEFKEGCNFPIACSLQYKSTNWQSLRFQIHHKKRRLTLLTNRLKHLRVKPIKVFVPHGDIFVVGSKDESFGNQVSQWNGSGITFRVPKCLESRFGKAVSSEVGDSIATSTGCQNAGLRPGISTVKTESGLLPCNLPPSL
jgi:hypothetical protein